MYGGGTEREMKPFIKIFLSLLAAFVIGVAIPVGIVFVAELIVGSTDGVLFGVVFALLSLLAIAAILSIALR